MLLNTLGASLIENILAGKGAIAKKQGQSINRAGYENKKGKGIIRVAYGFKRSSIKLDF